MWSLFVQTLPIAVVIALEPICIIAALVMPATERPLANSLAYLGALIGVMLGYGTVVLLLFQHHAIAAGSTRTDDIVQLLWLLIGLGFLAAFVVILVRRPQRTRRPTRVPLDGLGGEDGTTRRCRRRRLPRELGDGDSGAHGDPEVAGLDGSGADDARALHCRRGQHAVVPVGAYLVAPDKVGGGLARAKAWLGRHERVIVLILFCLIGAAFTVKGGAALLKQ